MNIKLRAVNTSTRAARINNVLMTFNFFFIFKNLSNNYNNNNFYDFRIELNFIRNRC